MLKKRRIVVRNKHRVPLVSHELENKVGNLRAKNGSEPARRRVKKQDVRARHQGTAYRNELLLTATQSSCTLGQPLLEQWYHITERRKVAPSRRCTGPKAA